MNTLRTTWTRSVSLIFAFALGACDGNNGQPGPGGGDAEGGGGANAGGNHAGGQDAGGNHAGGQNTGGQNTGGEATGGSNTGGGLADDLASLSNGFEDANQLGCLQWLHEVNGTSAPYTLMNINSDVPGHLVIEPLQGGWYQNERGPFLFCDVTGDFVAEADVGAYSMSGGAPTAGFTSVGLLARDPASTFGDENWLMYNVGRQPAFIGVEGKATVHSASELPLIQAPNHVGRVRICRVGNEFRMLHLLDGEADWVLTHTYPTTFVSTEMFTFPETLQVGIITNAYSAADLHGEVDHLRFSRVSSLDECTKVLP